MANPWFVVGVSDSRARGMLRRHYSANPSWVPGRSVRCVGPGEPLVLMTVDSRAVFAWLHNTVPRMDGQWGIYCPLFRNEGEMLSSWLILKAEELAVARWPEEARLFTYVNAGEVASPNPGYCFKMAGWRLEGVSKARGHLLLVKDVA